MADQTDTLDDGFELMEDDDLNFDFDDISGETKNRKPIDTMSVATKSAAKSLAPGVAIGLRAGVTKAFPEVGSLLDEGESITGDIKGMSRKFMKDIESDITTMKRFGQFILPKLDKVLPSSIQNKLTELTKVEEKQAVDTVEDARDRSIGSAVSDVFSGSAPVGSVPLANVSESKEQIEREQIKDKKADVNAFIDRRMNVNMFEMLFEEMRKMSVHVATMGTFTKTTYTAYLKKSLELKYRHMYATQDILKLLAKNLSRVNSVLDKIQYNTALPDLVKKKKSEVALEALRGKVLSDGMASLSNMGKQLRTNLKEQVFEKGQNFASALSMGLDSAMSGADMAESMGVDKKEAFADMGGGIAGDVAGGVAGQKIIKFLTTRHPELAKKLAGATTAKEDTIRSMNEWKDDLEMQGGLKGMLGAILPGIETSTPGSVLKDNAKDEVVYDLASRTSLVTIIPGYLAKILKEVTSIRTGDKDGETDELAYSAEKNGFVNRADHEKHLQKEAISSFHSSTEYASRNVIADIEKQSDMGSTLFEHKGLSGDVKDDIRRFIVNVGLSNRNLKPKSLYNAWKEEEDPRDTFDDWVSSAFKGTKHPKETLDHIVKFLFDENGKTITSHLSSLKKATTDVFKSQHEVDDYIRTTANDLGQAQYLGGILKDGKLDTDHLTAVAGSTHDIDRIYGKSDDYQNSLAKGSFDSLDRIKQLDQKRYEEENAKIDITPFTPTLDSTPETGVESGTAKSTTPHMAQTLSQPKSREEERQDAINKLFGNATVDNITPIAAAPLKTANVAYFSPRKGPSRDVEYTPHKEELIPQMTAAAFVSTAGMMTDKKEKLVNFLKDKDAVKAKVKETKEKVKQKAEEVNEKDIVKDMKSGDITVGQLLNAVKETSKEEAKKVEEKYQLKDKVSQLDEKYKVSEKAKAVDEKYKLSEKYKTVTDKDKLSENLNQINKTLETITDKDKRSEVIKKLDEKYKVQENLKKADEKYKVSEKLKTADEKYKLSEKYNTAVNKIQSDERLQKINEKYKVSDKYKTLVDKDKRTEAIKSFDERHKVSDFKDREKIKERIDNLKEEYKLTERLEEVKKKARETSIENIKNTGKETVEKLSEKSQSTVENIKNRVDEIFNKVDPKATAKDPNKTGENLSQSSATKGEKSTESADDSKDDKSIWGQRITSTRENIKERLNSEKAQTYKEFIKSSAQSAKEKVKDKSSIFSRIYNEGKGAVKAVGTAAAGAYTLKVVRDIKKILKKMPKEIAERLTYVLQKSGGIGKSSSGRVSMDEDGFAASGLSSSDDSLFQNQREAFRAAGGYAKTNFGKAFNKMRYGVSDTLKASKNAAVDSYKKHKDGLKKGVRKTVDLSLKPVSMTYGATKGVAKFGKNKLLNIVRKTKNKEAYRNYLIERVQAGDTEAENMLREMDKITLLNASKTLAMKAAKGSMDLAKGGFNVAKDVTSMLVNSTKSVINGLLGFDLSLLGKGIGKVWGGIKHIGASVEDFFMGKWRVNKTDLKKEVGERLVELIEKVSHISDTLDTWKAKTKGDADGDGIREGSYADKMKKKKQALANRAKGLNADGTRKRSAAEIMKNSRPGSLIRSLPGASLIGAAGAKIGGGAKAIMNKVTHKSDSDDDDSTVGTMLKGAAGGMVTKAVLGSAVGSSVVGGVTSAAAGAGSAIAGAGSALLAAAVSPVGLAVLGTVAVAATAYGIYKWMQPDGGEQYDALEKSRMRAYGALEGQTDVMLDLEELLMKVFAKERKGITDDELEEYAEKFGLIDRGWFSRKVKDEKDRVVYFNTWLRTRAVPVAWIFFSILKGRNIDYDDLDDAEPEECAEMLNAFNRVKKRAVSKSQYLYPNFKAYTEYKKQHEKNKKLRQQGKLKAAPQPKKQNDVRDDHKAISSKKYNDNDDSLDLFREGSMHGQSHKKYDIALSESEKSLLEKGKEKTGVDTGDISELQKKWIKHDEGLSLVNYKDTLGNDTIGYGHLNREGYQRITKPQADALFENDFEKHMSEVNTLPESQVLDPVRKAAVMNMVYNMGLGGYKSFKNMRRHLLNGRFKKAAQHILMSKYARQVKGRAKRVADVISSGLTKAIPVGGAQVIQSAAKKALKIPQAALTPKVAHASTDVLTGKADDIKKAEKEFKEKPITDVDDDVETYDADYAFNKKELFRPLRKGENSYQYSHPQSRELNRIVPGFKKMSATQQKAFRETVKMRRKQYLKNPNAQLHASHPKSEDKQPNVKVVEKPSTAAEVPAAITPIKQTSVSQPTEAIQSADNAIMRPRYTDETMSQYLHPSSKLIEEINPEYKHMSSTQRKRERLKIEMKRRQYLQKNGRVPVDRETVQKVNAFAQGKDGMSAKQTPLKPQGRVSAITQAATQAIAPKTLEIDSHKDTSPMQLPQTMSERDSLIQRPLRQGERTYDYTHPKEKDLIAIEPNYKHMSSTQRKRLRTEVTLKRQMYLRNHPHKESVEERQGKTRMQMMAQSGKDAIAQQAERYTHKQLIQSMPIDAKLPSHSEYAKLSPAEQKKIDHKVTSLSRWYKSQGIPFVSPEYNKVTTQSALQQIHKSKSMAQTSVKKSETHRHVAIDETYKERGESKEITKTRKDTLKTLQTQISEQKKTNQNLDKLCTNLNKSLGDGKVFKDITKAIKEKKNDPVEVRVEHQSITAPDAQKAIQQMSGGNAQSGGGSSSSVNVSAQRGGKSQPVIDLRKKG